MEAGEAKPRRIAKNDGLSVYGAASEVRFSGFAGNFPRVRSVCPALMKGRCPSFPPVRGEFLKAVL